MRSLPAAGQYQNYYLQNLKKPECIVAPNLRIRRSINCNPPTYPLNGSSADTYNSTSYNDDLAWAAMWMYRSGSWRHHCSSSYLDECPVCERSLLKVIPSDSTLGDLCWPVLSNRATGDGGYLNDAKQFFGAYQSSPESLLSPNLIVDWNNNFWSTAILLASQVRTAVQSIEHIFAVPTLQRHDGISSHASSSPA